MSGTFAVVTAYRGHASTTAGLARGDAERWVAELPGLLDYELDKPPEVLDLLPELEARFPAGGAVWLGPRVHWRPGQPGTVAAGEPESFARWSPQAGPVPWFIGTGGAYVFAALDDGYASWWPARWLETR
jgi:hypothetical protein